MVIPLGQQAVDERHRTAPLRYSAAWNTAGASVNGARQAVRTLLARAGHRPDQRPSQDAQLVVSELVTNALRHAPGPGALLLEVASDATTLLIAVRDTSPRPPEVQARDGGRIGGHGLHLVSRLCEQMHTVLLETGKQVMVRLSLDPVAE
ncbi:ATP-binding protein [Streptomyces bungoensis]|uniref:ATP-binding protein n=1 Tax=Streptomyces bungoensis TaxID=285568 RepID=UPI0034221499